MIDEIVAHRGLGRGVQKEKTLKEKRREDMNEGKVRGGYRMTWKRPQRKGAASQSLGEKGRKLRKKKTC